MVEEVRPAKYKGDCGEVGGCVAEVRIVWNSGQIVSEDHERREQGNQEATRITDCVPMPECLPLVLDEEPDHRRFISGNAIFVEKYRKQGPTPRLIVGRL